MTDTRYQPSDRYQVMKLGMECTEDAACMGEIKNAERILARKPEGKDHLGISKKTILKWILTFIVHVTHCRHNPAGFVSQ
jgi:hypothetical protein